MQSLVTVCGFLFLTFSVHAHVVENFEGCRNFFYNNFVPRGLNSGNDVHICQSFRDRYRFATLYNTGHRIPVYSAYVYEANQLPGGVQSSRWFVEPQLVEWSNNMMTVERVVTTTTMIDTVKLTQAVDEDYSNLQGYNHGHLNPRGHHHNADDRRATYTLTNIVPMNINLNQHAWNQYENKFITNCNKAYVLVGAIPSANNLANNRVNIPDYLWHAYCCVDINGNPIKSGAATAKNTKTTVQERSLDDLKNFFSNLSREVPDLFYNNCQI